MKIFNESGPGVGEPITKKIEEKEAESTPSELLLERAEKNKHGEVLLSFLKEKGVFSFDENEEIVFDFDLLEDPVFKAEMHKKYIGKNENGYTDYASMKRILEMFSGIKVKDVKGVDDKEQSVDFSEIIKNKKEEIPKKKILDFLEKMNVVEEKEGVKVVDLKLLSSRELWGVGNKMYLTGNKRKEGQKRVDRKHFFDMFGDLEVISRKDYEKTVADKSEVKTKKLFNVPKTINDAFEEKGGDDHYMNFWDLYEGMIQWDNNVTMDSGEKVGVKELYLYTKLFKEHGARRNDEGVLEVFDKTENNYVRLNMEWLQKNLGSMGSKTHFSGEGFQNFLISNCPNLLEKGLLNLNDAEIITSSETGRLLRKEFPLNDGSKDVMINGVKYYIGRENIILLGEKILKKNASVVILDDKTAGITTTHKGEEKLIFTFDLLSPEEINNKREEVKKKYLEKKGRKLKEKQVTARVCVKKAEFEARAEKWSVLKDNLKRGDETEEEYQERVGSLNSFSYIKDIGSDFSRHCQIGIHNLSWKEQQWLISACHNLATKDKYDKFLEFGKNYGLNGLKSFLSVEQDKNMGEVILSIGKQLEKESVVADELFSKYATLVDGANQRADDLLKMYKEIFFKKSIDRNEVINNILKQAKDLLFDAHENLKDATSKEKKEVVQNLINELDRIDNINNKAIGDIKAAYIKLFDEKKKMISEMADDDPVLLLKNILGDYEKYETPEELNVAIESGEIETWWMDRKWLSAGAVKKEIDYLAQKADAHVLERMAETSKQKIGEQAQNYKEYEILDDERFKEETRGREMYYETESKTYGRHKEENQKRQDRVGRIENILAIQNNFEALFDSFALNKKVEFDEGDLSGKVMQKYQSLLEKAKSSKKVFANIFKGDKEISDVEIDRIGDSLVVKAEGLLDDYVQKISKTDEDKKQEVLDEFVKKLERSNIEIDLLSSVLRSAKDDGEKIDLDIISGVGIDFKDKGEDFSEDAGEAEKIKKIIIEQSIEGRQKPGEAWEEVKKQAGILDTQEALESIKKIKTYTLKYQGEIMGFIYFKPTHTDENGKTHYYASGLNVLKDLQGLNVGANFMKTTILEEANKDNQILDALTSIDKKVSSYYIENLPFVINGYKDDYKDDKPRFSITIDNSQEKKISGKTISKDKIRERAMEISHQQVIERMKLGEKTIYLKYDINGGDEKQFVNEVSRILPNRNNIGGNENEAVTEYCVSRYYDEKREDGVVFRYLVLENVS